MKSIDATGVQSKKFSILFCTHNSERVISEALIAIQRQTAIEAVCEVIIVDYKSTDQTLRIAENMFEKSRTPLVVLTCEQPGKSPAIILGLNSAKGDYTVVVDDDNILAENFIEVAKKNLIDEYIGCLGSMGFMEKENMSSLPEWFERHKGVYAIGLPNNGKITDWVWGAASIINQKAWDVLRERKFSFKLNPARLTSSTPIAIGGEDVELSLAIKLIGYKISASKDLKFIHKFEPSRLTENYLLKTARGVSRAVVVHEIYRIACFAKSPFSIFCILHLMILRKILGQVFAVIKNSMRKESLDARYSLNTLLGIISGYFFYCAECHSIGEVVLKIKSGVE